MARIYSYLVIKENSVSLKAWVKFSTFIEESSFVIKSC